MMGALRTVRSPVRIRAMLEKAPSSSLFSIAFEVPTAWALDPRANPFAMVFLILNVLLRKGDIAAPKMPVTMTTLMVMAGMPPSVSLNSFAKGVVIDFGMRLMAICSLSDNRMLRNTMVMA